LYFQPGFGLLLLALWATSVAAGVVAVADFATVWAGKHLSTQRFGSAALNRAHGLVMTGQEARGVFLAIGWTVLAKDISQF